MNRVVYAAVGGALRTILKDILAKIDAEIARLELVKASLSEPGQRLPISDVIVGDHTGVTRECGLSSSRVTQMSDRVL